MTENQKNAALAKWLSQRTGKKYQATAGTLWVPDHTGEANQARAPFTASLDQMALIRDAMSEDERRDYAWNLAVGITGPVAEDEMTMNDTGLTVFGLSAILSATPEQCADAAVRALSLLESEEV